MKKLFFIGVLIGALCGCGRKNDSAGPEQAGISSHHLQDTSKIYVYLTFDDGPTEGSERLWDFLMREQVPATLFLVGKHYEAMPGLKHRLDSLRTKPFILLANHGYSHAYNNRFDKFYNDVPGVIQDYLQAQQVLGIPGSIARCAGRNVWRSAMLFYTDEKGPSDGVDSLFARGMQFTGWDCVWGYDYRTFKNTLNDSGMLAKMEKCLDSNKTKLPKHIV
ncbi:MAG: polysaccharide deacetylase family protein, partial [Chitinophagaceae bacterium]|nr:polysaccharide deacetylase family protein [Chitinophagaceae bacterium]